MRNPLSKAQMQWLIVLLVGLAVLLLPAYFAVNWFYNRFYVPEGYSLRLRYKGPPLSILPGGRPAAKNGQFARVDENGNPLELGVLEQLRGPGRHFYCPLWWERSLVEDKLVSTREVAFANCRMGKEFTGEDFLVEGDLGATEYKGDLRKVFGPGRYRVNDYAYDFEAVKKGELPNRMAKLPVEPAAAGDGQSLPPSPAGWVEIPTGYVAVVTNLAANANTGELRGIQDNVLPPGIYLINPLEKRLDIVEIGYREKSITSNLKKNPDETLELDSSGEPIIADEESGIHFPSSDGFPIHMDFTAIWGIMPDRAPDVIRNFKNVQDVEDVTIVPEINNVCLGMGSTLEAVDLLIGESRQQFQTETSERFRQVLEKENISLLYGLVRHIYIPQEVRQPIQLANIADELKLTREQEQLTAKTEALLREAEETVKLETERVKVETDKLVAEAIAQGNRQAEETNAETLKLTAAIDKKVAELEAKATVVLGEANANAQKMSEEAKADKFRLAVEAFGSGEAYNHWVFASGLPDDIRLDLFYAGEGTFWTDLKSFSDVLLGRQTQQSSEAKRPVAPARPTTKPATPYGPRR